MHGSRLAQFAVCVVCAVCAVCVVCVCVCVSCVSCVCRVCRVRVTYFDGTEHEGEWGSEFMRNVRKERGLGFVQLLERLVGLHHSTINNKNNMN
jgi:hypothetical protein